MKNALKWIYITGRNLLILLLLLEIVLGIYYYYHDKSGINNNTERIISSGLYKGLNNTIVKEIHRELRQQDMQWEPYLHYSFIPFYGKHNTILKNKQRKTYNPSKTDSLNPFKIFCFGGSTMYSSGARDEFTIPSELSKLIAKEFPNKNIEVTNFGCHGYTRATENIQLQQELIKDNIPNLVIFYDGVNEVISAHQNNKAGTPTNAYNRKKEFKIAHSYKKRIKLFITSSNLFRAITALQLKLRTNSYYSKLDARSDSLSIKIAKNYTGLVKISKSLENTYGFTVYNFLQPNIYSKKQLSEAEKRYYNLQKYYKNLYELSYKHIRKDLITIKDSTFTDISNVFNNTNKTIYFDFCHTGEFGNTLVAKKIFETIKNNLPKNDSLFSKP